MSNEFKRMQQLAGVITKSQLNEDEKSPNEILSLVRSELISLFKPYGDFQIVDMARLQGEKVGEEFRVYAKRGTKGTNWKGLENFMRNNPNFIIKHISKQTFDNPKAIDFTYKK